MRRKNLALRVISTAAFLAIVSSCAAPAFADAYGIATYGNYYLDQGSISVRYDNGDYYVTVGDRAEEKDAEGKVTISNSKNEDGSVNTNPTATSNTITIINNTEDSKACTEINHNHLDSAWGPDHDTSAKITLDNVNIDTSGQDKAGITVKGKGDVTIEIDNTGHDTDTQGNTIKGSGSHAGIEKNDGESSGTLVIRDDNIQGTGKLEVTGGAGAAGIGSAKDQNTSNVLIDNGKITAKGGDSAEGGGAAIGSGANGKAENITINNGVFNVTGGNGTGENANGGAAIGSGANGENKKLTTKNGQFTAEGGSGVNGGAAIGSGGNGQNTSTTIENGTFNTVTGGSGSSNGGAGIGSGGAGKNENTTVGNGTFNSSAAGGSGTNGGAGIGSGGSADTSHVTISGGAEVIGQGTDGGAGIGGGANGGSATITITGGVKITGNGSKGAAGIGGGVNGTADVTITGGQNVTGNGGEGGAGIGGGQGAAGSNSIKVTDGWNNIGVTGNGGEGGAGIGSGKGSAAANAITVEGENPRGDRTEGPYGADVKGIGGSGAAGIGGGEGGKGGSITLSGGKVEAEGGDGAYAIGSGKGASGSDVTIAGTYKDVAWGALDVTATAKTGSTRAGSIIEGGEKLTHDLLDNIHRTIVRFTNNNGWFKTLHNEKYAGYYADNHEELTHEDDSQHLWQETDRREPTAGQDGYIRYVCQIDHCDERDVILPRLGYPDEDSDPLQNKTPWLHVADKDKKLPQYDLTCENRTATYHTELDDAILTGNFAALAQLHESGIDTVVFTTGQCTSSFRLDGLDLANEECVFELTHTGTHAVLTVDGQPVNLLH